jgi:hypothetical protein
MAIFVALLFFVKFMKREYPTYYLILRSLFYKKKAIF